MVDVVYFEAASVAVMVAAVAFAALRKRSFVLFATLGMFAVAGIALLPGARPSGLCYMPDLAWRYLYLFEPQNWYRLFTHLFVHDSCGGAHIIGNVFTLVLLGWPLEEKIGWKRTAAIFFLTGAVGAVLSSLFVVALEDAYWLGAAGFGASGSIFGLIAYFAVRYPQEKVYAPLLFIFARVPVSVAAVVALAVQALVLMQVNSIFVGQLPWPSVLAHVSSFVVGMFAVKIPGLRVEDNPRETAGHLDLSRLRDLVVKPADKMAVEEIIAEDIPEVAQAKLESFLVRARCPRCGGEVRLKGRKLVSDCGWSVTFQKRRAPKGER